jgi:HK97 family phage major capsid protein
VDHFTSAAATAVRSALARARDAADMLTPDSSWLRLCARVNPQRAIAGLMQESLDGAEREAHDTLDGRHRVTESNCVQLPWESVALRSARYHSTRADIVGASAAGGYLVETLNLGSAAQALMSLLILGRLGCTALDSPGPNLALPKVTGGSAASWLTNETTQITEADQTFGAVNFEPHVCGGYTTMSRLLLLQSVPGAADVVAADLGRRAARAIEAACFNGGGTGGAPHGVIGLTGVGAVSGTAFSLASAMTAVGDIGDALDPNASPAWACDRATALLLRQRAELVGSSLTLWRGPATFGQLADYPAAASSGLPSATAIFGSWRFAVLLNWGGLMVSVNPYANFQAGVVAMRLLSTVDFGVVWPGAFTTVSSIT